VEDRGEILDDLGEEVAERISGTDAYEWLGASFVVHRVEVAMGGTEGAPTRTVCDEGAGCPETALPSERNDASPSKRSLSGRAGQPLTLAP
jgi:hypothetical protein